MEYCVTTDVAAFTQTEEEALGLLRLPPGEIPEEPREETGASERA